MSDYIDREEVKKMLYYVNMGFTAHAQALQGIEKLPSADVIDRNRGEWIERIGGISKELFYQCSKCYGEVDTHEFHYCPWCGANMRGEQDE